MKITIIGANGMLGQPVAQQLIDSGFEVSIIARFPQKIKAIFQNAKIIQGDVFDEKSLENALQGQDLVYLNLSVLQTELQQQPHTEAEGLANVLKVSKAVGVKHIAYLSSMVMDYQGTNGFDWWVFGIKHEAVNMIKASGLGYSIFYPSTFMESLPMQTQGIMLGMIGHSQHKMWFIAAKDYAKQVAKSFDGMQLTKQASYYIQGPVALDYQQASRIYVKNHPSPFLFIMTLPTWLVKLMGKVIPKMNYAHHICEALNNYPEPLLAAQTWEQLGKPTTTLVDFVKGIKQNGW